MQYISEIYTIHLICYCIISIFVSLPLSRGSTVSVIVSSCTTVGSSVFKVTGVEIIKLFSENRESYLNLIGQDILCP